MILKTTLIPIVEKIGFASHTKHIAKATRPRLENTSNHHPHGAREVSSLNQFTRMCSRENKRITYTHIHTISIISMIYFLILKIIYVSLLIHNWLSNWPFGPAQLGFNLWLEIGPKGTNKTLSPMGIRLICQLLTSPKLPLIIFNTTI